MLIHCFFSAFNKSWEKELDHHAILIQVKTNVLQTSDLVLLYQMLYVYWKNNLVGLEIRVLQ